MQFYSTNNKASRFSFEEAVMQSLPADNGLYMPVEIRPFASYEITQLFECDFPELSFRVAKQLLAGAIDEKVLRDIVYDAVNFEAPVVSLDEDTHVLELFHGPSLAFKDFGARFMARTMGYFNRHASKPLNILVATSGDTGGAVAAGFYNTPGIRVVILYPSGKVSPLQEKQLTTLGGNIHALEIEGTFDDCQALVKQAFLDQPLNDTLRLSSANSINIARLIPQSFYYFEAYKQLKDKTKPVHVVVPSGNFGNLTAGLLAQKLGLPIVHYIAATNANDVVPQYLSTGLYKAKPSVRTLSNAMDVGNPSNFVRMLDLYGSTWNTMADNITGYSVEDAETAATLNFVFQKYSYLMCPHTAVAFRAHKAYQSEAQYKSQGLILSTAHPAKFLEDVEHIIQKPVDIPDALLRIANKKKKATLMPPQYDMFKYWLKSNLD
jgi:threonine synthase